ncbi:AraC family transcriptional regulator [Vallitalea okinawensis]|uniref:AraC family transcriptional regulator n=1 Tax=Vallitalea okinawensis TaxID=2078660 RepID=UPI0014781A74|nr:AraC family transcriptional regulator [Vallitalea okinawensis]
MGLFKRLFIMLLAVIVLPALIIMIVNYNITKEFIEEETKLANHQILQQTKVASDTIIHQTENISYQISVNNQVLKFFHSNLDPNIYEEYEVLDQVYDVSLNFLGGTPYIEEISIYSISNDLLISTKKTEHPAVSVKTPDYLKKMADQYSDQKWIEPNATGVFWAQFDGLQFVRFIYTNGNELEGFVVIQLKNDDFNRIINEMYIKKTGFILVADQTGKIILNTDKGFHSLIDLNINYDWFEEDENYQKVEIDDKEYLLSLVTSNYNQWKYLALVDTSEINEKMAVIRYNTLFLSGLFLVVAFFLALAMSKGIYNPIKLIQHALMGEEVKEKAKLNYFLLGENEFADINLSIHTLRDELSDQKQLKSLIENEITELRIQQETNAAKLKKYFFYRLIRGEKIDEAELTTQLKRYDIAKDDYYQILLIDLGFKEVMRDEEVKKHDEVRQNLIAQVYQLFTKDEIVEHYYEVNDRLILILRTDHENSQEVYSQKNYQKAETIQKAMLSKFDRKMTIALSQEVAFDHIQQVYEESFEALKYNLILGSQQIIKSKELEKGTGAKRLSYDYRKYLNNSMRSFSLEECKTIVLELQKVIKSDLGYVRDYAYYYKDVLNIIIGFLYEIQYVNASDLEELSGSFAEFEHKFTNIDEATNWIIRFMTNIFNFLQSANAKETNPMIMDVLKIIEEGYMKDLSLTELSERMGVTVPYLSKLFKEEMKVNFKEYLTVYKIEKSKQLLLHSSNTIQEVAELVGYNNSLQFTRMFKKYEHITPAAYRRTQEKN